MLTISMLAALAVPLRSLAQAPTFNTLATTYTGNPNYEHPQTAGDGDFNGDGKLDALVSTGSPNLRLMLGNGDGTFTQLYVSAPGTNPGPIKVADLNGDGKLDAITVSNQGNLAATVLINTGNDINGVPQFTATNYNNPAFGTSGLRSLTVGDLNGDGKPDFVVGDANGALRVWLNNGDGTFTGGQYYSLQPGAGGPSVGPGAIADLNGDGKADYLVTSNQNHAINVFFGNGDGTFQATPAIIPSTDGMWPVISDLNNDGKPDFLAVDIGTGMLQVYLNNGNGTFSGPTLYATGLANPCSLAFTDMNGDGKMDVVTSDYNNGSGVNNVAVLLGNGDGTFGAANLYNSTQRALDLSVGDFNGDGKPDIGTVGYNNDVYGVLLNTTPAPLPTQTLTILGGNGTVGGIATNVEYYNPATGLWQPAYLVGTHPWGEVAGTTSWINYKPSNRSDPGAGVPNGTNSTLWYLYRVRFTVPSDALNPKMTFSVKADNFAQVAINGVAAGGSTQYINYTNMNNVIVGQTDQLSADAVFAQAVHTGENTITVNMGDWGGLNGFNFRIDLSMQSSQPLQIVPTVQPPAVTSETKSGGYGSAFSYQISATNSPTSYGASSLPAGLSFNPATGVISGMLPNTVGTSTIGLSATNGGGTGTGVLTINVVDTNPPVISAPSPITAEATGPGGAVVNFTATANDAISGSVPVTATPASGSTFPLGLSVVTLSATDAAGNHASGVFRVTVVDTTPPVIAPPGNLIAEATGASGAAVTFSASASDLVDGAVALTASPASGSTFARGTTTVTLTATDAHANTASRTFTVTVRDTTPPVLALPASQTLEATGPTGAVATFTASALDLVSGAVAVNFSTPSGSTLPLGTTTVLATATDAAGNTAAGSFTVTVVDTTPPVLTLPANQTLEATGPTGAIATFAASATDLVTASPTIAYSVAPGSTFALGTTTITVTATDAAGNATTGSFTVTVRDTTPPVISSLTANPATLWPPNHKMVNVTVTAVVADLVDPAPVTKIVSVTSNEAVKTNDDDDQSPDWLITGNLTLQLRAERLGKGTGRIYTITVQSTDSAGNVSTKTVTVTVPKDQGDKDTHKDDDKKDTHSKQG